MNPLTRAYHDVVIYGDAASDDVLYEGPIVVHANGWIELEGNRLLSPQAIHHIDIYDDERGEWATGDGSDNNDGGDAGSGDDHRTNRFSTR
ncbi:hypothetical protein GCU68_00570 [Natronorubrum aibiense]|uniref:Uncharacterized protein n=2 Tax=Natronorubrum aibiense TaxID=348826 RepID=A0A5P9P796_9EURY|nr:hypothetical protein GCU68_00570 [Natronorubrum aibiense]